MVSVQVCGRTCLMSAMPVGLLKVKGNGPSSWVKHHVSNLRNGVTAQHASVAAVFVNLLRAWRQQCSSTCCSVDCKFSVNIDCAFCETILRECEVAGRKFV